MDRSLLPRRALALVAGASLLLAGVWFVARTAPRPTENPPDGLSVTLPGGESGPIVPIPAASDDAPPAPVRPRVPSVPPPPPGPEAEASELWAYGERYLDWLPPEPGSAGYTVDELASWIDEDLSLRHVGEDQGYGEFLGYMD